MQEWKQRPHSSRRESSRRNWKCRVLLLKILLFNLIFHFEECLGIARTYSSVKLTVYVNGSTFAGASPCDFCSSVSASRQAMFPAHFHPIHESPAVVIRLQNASTHIVIADRISGIEMLCFSCCFWFYFLKHMLKKSGMCSFQSGTESIFRQPARNCVVSLCDTAENRSCASKSVFKHAGICQSLCRRWFSTPNQHLLNPAWFTNVEDLFCWTKKSTGLIWTATSYISNYSDKIFIFSHWM